MKLRFDFLVFCLAYAPGVWGGNIDYSRPPESTWPVMTIVRHYGNTKKCDNDALACAFVNFRTRICDIYYPWYDPDRRLIRHEEAHCAGYDHDDDSIMHDAWAKYKETK